MAHSNTPHTIQSFRDRRTEQLFFERSGKDFGSASEAAWKKLQILNAIVSLEELRYPPGNRLETLRGDRIGQYSIRVNQQYRICFEWQDGLAYNVEIVDYH